MTDENKDQYTEANKVFVTTMYVGIDVEEDALTSSNADQKGEKYKLDIHVPCAEFYNLCHNFSDEYNNNDKFQLVIRYVKAVELPDNVFEEGERPPAKKRKTVPATTGATSATERPNKKPRTQTAQS